MSLFYAFNEREEALRAPLARNLCQLVKIWGPPPIFKKYYYTPAFQTVIFCEKKPIIVSEILKKSGKKLQMSDILKKGAELKAFELNRDDVKQFIEKAEQKQEDVLKLKEVKEEQLRKVVQF